MVESGRVAPRSPITEAWRILTTHDQVGNEPTGQETLQQECEDDQHAGLMLTESGQDSNSQPTVAGSAVECSAVEAMERAGDDAWDLFQEVLDQGSEDEITRVLSRFKEAVESFKKTMMHRGMNFEMSAEERKAVVNTVARDIFGRKPSCDGIFDLAPEVPKTTPESGDFVEHNE